MIKIKAFLGYIAAILTLFVVLATFIGNDFFAKRFVDITSLKVSPIYTGGEVSKVLSFNDYQVKIHKPVFQGLFSDKSKGFVQIDYEGKNIPAIISQNIDFDNDGNDDFYIKYDVKNDKSEFKALNKNVVSLEGVYKVKGNYAVRVSLKK
ncbi:hypothetical protein JMF89_11055 [Clostridiaceae bacterium UIB06]|uniref:Uncharacterized protein n=1 Tax=Clostridium thailandense TaxID=2794346 RepID=A0A949X3T0_9CLOT|nr:hypothetical protein [Clostridium thailandense]MBV7275224.1 hypothetical protein [Clostridium thailandense]MCH5137735.1 hypothetical protein [Clostridiaceae bacterium UIB06]